eukprot:TRINITY_DN4913_c0_g2_i3.p1 TRINITY_DN4913_c0_g2~~TRINITY_DN4913_c0_g2_i3.p1  ORF type:complete len:197 (+),score=40.37 TRINITY_DN4913_c0_g2_i3:608-1198(+)
MITVASELCTYPMNHYAEGNESLIKYPLGMGITGKVFEEGEHRISDSGKEEREFQNIDNPEFHKSIRNFIFIPIYKYDGKKNGVLQLFNKKEGDPSTDELNKIAPYQRLIGMLVESLIEFDKSVQIQVNIKRLVRLMENLISFNKTKGGSSISNDMQTALYKLQQLVEQSYKSLSLIHICRCRRIERCRSRWSPYH